MAFYRLKHSFTSGELTPLMNARIDFKRYQNGCKILKNMYSTTQGPVIRRSGFKFVFDLLTIGLDINNPVVRMIPFVFNEIQAYAMVFYTHTNGSVRMVLATTTSEGIDGLVVDDQDLIVTLILPADWDIENFDWAQSADEMWIAQSPLQPHIIKRLGHDDWQLLEVTFTDQPADWSDENGWPEKITFHQQRVSFAANLLRRQTVWMSKAGDFTDFGISSPLVDSDAVTFTLDSNTQNKVQWLISSKSLNVGTLGSEWTVGGNDRDALTPSNILAQRQTNNGSEPNKPLLIGLTTLFLERHGRTINDFKYVLEYDSYRTVDISVVSPHLTVNDSIVEWTYQQTPDSIVWCIRADGILLGLTYQDQHKVYGWHQHTTDGEFKAITTIPGRFREDSVWTVVKREIEGSDKYYIEKLDGQFTKTEAEHGRFLDSYIDYIGIPTSTLTGAIHLANRTVDILADGTVHPPVVVQSDGSLTLNKEYSHVAIGLPYESEVRPYLADLTSDRMGTAIGRMQRITELSIDLYNSLGMWIGRDDFEDGESEEEQPFRVPGDLMGQAVPLYSGIYNMDFPEGFDRKSEYFIRQRQPLPLMVLGVTDLVEVFE